MTQLPRGAIRTPLAVHNFVRDAFVSLFGGGNAAQAAQQLNPAAAPIIPPPPAPPTMASTAGSSALGARAAAASAGGTISTSPQGVQGPTATTGGKQTLSGTV